MTNNETTVIDILEERTVLVAEKQGLSQKLAALGISGNRAYYARGTIDKQIWEDRTRMASRVAEIEKRLGAIKSELKKKQPERYDLVKEIISQGFGKDFWIAVDREVARREQGASPIKITWEPKEQPRIKTYKGELTKAVSMLLSARNIITRYIMNNEPEVNKADYLIKVKELNNSLPSISEIEKLKP